MKAQLVVATLVVLAQGGMAAQAEDTLSDTLGAIDDAVDEAVEIVSNVADGVIPNVNDPSPVIGSQDFSEERAYLENVSGRLETLANENGQSWVIKDDVRNYTRFNVVVVKQGSIVANYSVEVNYSNRSVNITEGHLANPDATVYPRYEDVQYVDENYERLLEGNGTASDATKLWAIWRNTKCEPSDVCEDIRSSYSVHWDKWIGRLTG